MSIGLGPDLSPKTGELDPVMEDNPAPEIEEEEEWEEREAESFQEHLVSVVSPVNDILLVTALSQVVDHYNKMTPESPLSDKHRANAIQYFFQRMGTIHDKSQAV